MAISGNKYIYSGGTIVTIILLLSWFVGSNHFDTEIDLTDKVCAGTFGEPCEISYNITLVTLPYFYIRNNDAISLDFSPDVKAFYSCKKDGRYRSLARLDREKYPCGVGYREFDWKTPLTSKYKYINKFYKGKKQEFKLVIFKYNPRDEIKWGGRITKEEFDPILFGSINVTPIKKCKTTSVNRKVDDYKICLKNRTVDYINNVTKINETILQFYNNSCKIGSHIEIINTTICITTEYNVDGEKLKCEKVGAKCYRNIFDIIIKYPDCSNVDSPNCGEGSGECCDIIDVRNTSNRKQIGYDFSSNVRSAKIE